MSGSLFVVATPIGNLEDFTFRALRTLKEVDLIAAEDTRRTSKLLAHYGVSRPLVSLHEHNEHREAPRLVERIRAGASVALVSDAGTPAISDPGSTLVRLCLEAGLRVVPIPGPSAITAALSVSGFPAVPFTFLGFPPATGQAREHWFDQVADIDGVVVLFEAPHRIERTLTDLSRVKRPIRLHREITKIHEELVKWDKEVFRPGPIASKGEYVVVVGPPVEPEKEEIAGTQLLDVYTELSGSSLDEDQVIAAVAAAFGLPVGKTRTAIKKARILVKNQNMSNID
jgi:16S rRNA (cytidine1402-2'-O)-methyltransferase